MQPSALDSCNRLLARSLHTKYLTLVQFFIVASSSTRIYYVQVVGNRLYSLVVAIFHRSIRYEDSGGRYALVPSKEDFSQEDTTEA